MSTIEYALVFCQEEEMTQVDLPARLTGSVPHALGLQTARCLVRLWTLSNAHILDFMRNKDFVRYFESLASLHGGYPRVGSFPMKCLQSVGPPVFL